MATPYLYEVLIRLTASGVQGAHYAMAVETVDPFTNQASVQIGPATPIPLDSTMLSDLLGDATAVALAENAALQAQVSYLQAQLENLQNQLAEAQSDGNSDI